MQYKRNILVAGGAGFIGSCFVAQSVERGDNVIVLDALTYAGHKENLEGITGQGSFRLVEGNICDGALVANLLKNEQIDAVINFAAESHVDNSIHSPAIFMQTNIMGTYTLLEAAREYHATLASDAQQAFRYLHVSTDEVYGSLGETGYFTEASPMQPNSPYSASKAAADHLVRAWHHTYGLPTITTNCSNNYGPRQYPEKLIPHIITRALQGKSLPVYGDGKNVRDWIHVEDHCQGIYKALSLGVVGNTYCFGGRAERSNIDLVTDICAILDEISPANGGIPYKSQIKFVADRPGHDRRYAIDDTKAEKELGFIRDYTLETGLRKTVEWYLQHSGWCDAVMAA